MVDYNYEKRIKLNILCGRIYFNGYTSTAVIYWDDLKVGKIKDMF